MLKHRSQLWLPIFIIPQVLTYVTCEAATFGQLSALTGEELIFSFH